MKRPSPAATAGPINPHTLRSFGRRHDQSIGDTKRPQPFQPGSRCWLLYWPEEGVNPEYLPCIVVQVVNEECVDVNILGGDDDDEPQFLRVPVATLLEADKYFMHNDTAALEALNYPNVLETIRQRFEHAAESPDKSFIYTYAGWILFAVNPYSRCDSIYDPTWCERYFRKTITQELPHPFAIASIAYTKLIADHVPQYILISGESGGGKTECSKHILKYLTWVTWRQRRQRGRISVGGPADSAERLAELLIEANPLLEFFGNAKTARNDNSSRFGKLFQVYYDENGEHLLSARLCTYLLAKSRVVQVPSGEENYHVFHALMALDQVALRGLELHSDFFSPFLGDNRAHTDNGAYHLGGHFHISKLCDALTVFGLTTCYQVNLFQVLSSILHLGNIEFVQKPGQQGVKVANPEVLAIVCKLWGVEEKAVKRLEELLTSKQIRDARSLLTISQCKHTTFALAKGLYEALFEYLVGVVRRTLSCTGAGEVTDEENCIGVLDLFGFENMEPGSRNGFEQLCINYANEQLHHHFLREVIEKENQIYAAEGLVMVESAFGDIDQLVYSEALNVLLGSRNTPGVFNVLEDNCRMLQSRDPDQSFVRQVNQLLNTLRPPSPGKKRRMNADGSGSRLFTIHHFAEPVTYTADGFTDRNQDHISEEITTFLLTQTGGHIRVLFSVDDLQAVSSNKKSTVRSLSAVFIKQMSGLTNALEKTSCYFIKCLKPNDNQEPFEFDSGRVLRQLTTGGVGPVLELMTQGYPCRVTYDSLWAKFANYLPSDVIRKLDPRNFAELTMSFLDLSHDEYRLGISRVFFRFGVLQKVEGILLGFDEQMANRFRKEMHSWYKKHQFVRAVYAVMTLFRFSKQRTRHRKRKVMHELLDYSEKVLKPRYAARKIQIWWRHVHVGYQVRCWYKRTRTAIIRIQRRYRAHLLKRQQRYNNWLNHCVKGVTAILLRFYYRVVDATDRKLLLVVRIQSLWRGYTTRKRIRCHLATVRIQRWWRRARWGLKVGTRGRHPWFQRQNKSPLALDHTTPTRGGGGNSVLMRRGSMTRGGTAVNPTFKETRDALELKTKYSPDKLEQLVQDYGRSRRSVFGNSVARQLSPALVCNRLAHPKLHQENARALIPRNLTSSSAEESDFALPERGGGPSSLFAMPFNPPNAGRTHKAPPVRSQTYEERRNQALAGGQTPFAPSSVPGRTEETTGVDECRPTPLPRVPSVSQEPPPPANPQPPPVTYHTTNPWVAPPVEVKRPFQQYRPKGFAQATVVSRQQAERPVPQLQPQRRSDQQPPPPPLRKQTSLGIAESQRSSATGESNRFFTVRSNREPPPPRRGSRDRFGNKSSDGGIGSGYTQKEPTSEAAQSEPVPAPTNSGASRRQPSYHRSYQNFRPKLSNRQSPSENTFVKEFKEPSPSSSNSAALPVVPGSQQVNTTGKAQPPPVAAVRSPVNLDFRDQELQRLHREIERPLDPPQSVVARLSICRDDLTSKFDRSIRQSRRAGVYDNSVARPDSILPSEPSSILLDREGVPLPSSSFEEEKENISAAGRLSVGDLPVKGTKMGTNLCKPGTPDEDQQINDVVKPMTTTASGGEATLDTVPLSMSHCRLSVNAWREQAERIEQLSSPARPDGGVHPSTSGTEDLEDPEQTPLFGVRDDEKMAPEAVLDMEAPAGQSRSASVTEKENTPRPFQLSSNPQSLIASQHSRQSSQSAAGIKPGSSAVLSSHTRQASNARKQSSNLTRVTQQLGRQQSNGGLQSNPSRQQSGQPRGHYRTASGAAGAGRKTSGRRPHANYPVPLTYQADPQNVKVQVPSLAGQPARRHKTVITIKETDKPGIPGYGDKIPSRPSDESEHVVRIVRRARLPTTHV